MGALGRRLTRVDAGANFPPAWGMIGEARSQGSAGSWCWLPGLVTMESIGQGPSMLDRLSAIGRRHAGLSLLLLYGSRARGDASAGSDWDFGYLGTQVLDPLGLVADLVDALATDAIDLVDLARASGQLRFRAASEGRPVYENPEGTFARFWVEAVSFWCDAGPILRAGYAGILESLGR